ncbi:restriction endonuclease subunit S [Ligilactobacillus salivarius]|uniref:restriction endonuclease subunit S n=1 Tax=Ligilactobacillus salivarius TaxID=1624 RepID=UPI000BAF060F|nr:restriction endonuclease subunit S [Ligilactobacillus salivarius]PAY34235.1 hypothetical protein A8C54_01535 [Ligilactobacillus salivarius]PAY41192.1 hypothetical protein A8C34_00225 [Ligilactobacillus salivarius]
MKYYLKDIAKIKNGKKTILEDVGVKVYGSNGVIGFSKDSNAPRNSIIIGRVGANTGSVFFSDEEHWVTDNAISVVPNNKINPIYLFYLLKQKKLNRLAEGSAQPLVNQKILNSFLIDIPSLEIQNKIADKLYKIDKKIEINNKINTNLLQLSQIMFKNKFPNVNDGPDKIGAYIRNYDKDRKPLSKKQRSKMPGKYRYIGATSVNDYIAKYNFDGIYLLLGEDGTVQDINGYPVLQYIHGKFWPNNHAHVLQGNKVSTEWLYLFFLQRNIEGIITGAVQKKISQKNLNSLSVTMPNNEELSKFDNIIQPIFEQIRTLEEENERLLEIKKELLTNLF